MNDVAPTAKVVGQFREFAGLGGCERPSIDGSGVFLERVFL